MLLSDPTYAEFRKAREDALRENARRSALARAIMQNDLWSAYDILYQFKHYKENGENELAEHRLEVLGLLGRLIRKIALTPEEIRSLPENYTAARVKYTLPDLFGRNSGWVEVQWFPRRLHDESVNYRRVTRVFLKPVREPQDMQSFLNHFRTEEGNPAAVLDGVALIIQLLVIDTQGRLKPVGVSTDVQFRLFEKTKKGAFQKTQIGIYEVSRKRLLGQPESGGMVEEAESESAYLPSAGNDYTFASPQSSNGEPSTPLVVRLRTRCASCHGDSDLTKVMTFSFDARGVEAPVRQLNVAAHEAADFVVSQKTKGEAWKALRQKLRKVGVTSETHLAGNGSRTCRNPDFAAHRRAPDPMILESSRHPELIHFEHVQRSFCLVAPHAATFDQQAVTKSVRSLSPSLRRAPPGWPHARQPRE